MITDTFIFIFILSFILYKYNDKLHLFFGILILWILYKYYLNNTSAIHESITNISKSNKKEEYIDSNEYLKKLKKYRKYNTISFNKGIQYYKKYKKYLDKKTNSIKLKKIYLENSIYYLNKSKESFNEVVYKMDNISSINKLKGIIDNFYLNNYDFINDEINDKNLTKYIYEAPTAHNSF